MTLPDQFSRNDAVGNGSNKDFPYTFRISDQTDVQVLADGVVQILFTDYTVSGVGAQGGGLISFIVAPLALVEIAILRDQPVDQGSNYVPNEDFPAERIELDLDMQAMIQQMIREEVGRALKFKVESLDRDIDVDDLVADKFLRVNSLKDGISMADVVSAFPPLLGLPVGISEGGTGAITAPAARTNLDVPSNAEAILDTIFLAKADLLTALGAGLPTILPIGADGLGLIADSVQPEGMRWGTLQASVPTGGCIPTVRTTAPAGWLFADGSEANPTTFEDLFDEMLSNLTDWGLGTATGVFTADSGTDLLTLVAHGFSLNDVVHLQNAGGALPTGLFALTKYFVVTPLADTFAVALTPSGVPIDFTTNGTGVHSVHATFVLPDMRGRVPVGADNMGGVSADRIVATEADNLGQGFGTELHQLTIAELAAHFHTVPFVSISCQRVGGCETPGVNDSTITGGPTSTTTVGSDTPHPNVQPSQTYNWIVKT
jgi:microcystin-dependent protein